MSKDTSLDGMIWMQDAISQSGKSRWWIMKRCTIYKREYQTRWRSYVKKTELDRAMATYRAEVDVFKEAYVPTAKVEAHISV